MALEGDVGKRGPAPTPAKVLKMRGTYRPDRHGAPEGDVTVSVVSRVPRPPAHLSALAKKEWRTMAKRLHKIGILTVHDLPTLEAYCVARARAIEAETVVQAEGRTIVTLQGTKRHPELLTAERSWADCRKYEALFGMSPSARRTLGITEDETDTTGDSRAKRYFGVAKTGSDRR